MVAEVTPAIRLVCAARCNCRAEQICILRNHELHSDHRRSQRSSSGSHTERMEERIKSAMLARTCLRFEQIFRSVYLGSCKLEWTPTPSPHERLPSFDPSPARILRCTNEHHEKGHAADYPTSCYRESICEGDLGLIQACWRPSIDDLGSKIQVQRDLELSPLISNRK